MVEQDIGYTVFDLRVNYIDLTIDYGGDTELGYLVEDVLHGTATTGGPHLEIHRDGEVVIIPKDERGGVYLPAEALRALAEGIINLRRTRTSI